MNFEQLDEQLRQTFSDCRLSDEERDQLRQLGSNLREDQVRFMRNRAFDMVREIAREQPQQMSDALKWLEQVVKTLDMASAQPRITSTASFTPGNDCLTAIDTLCRRTQHCIDVCVFTISDNRLSDALIRCVQRGVRVRIITDNDKQYDSGSDIQLLRQEGIPLRMDDTDYHMHHKFALFDGKTLLNGSFNWTRSASECNAENILVTDDMSLVAMYQKQFDKLWAQYGAAES